MRRKPADVVPPVGVARLTSPAEQRRESECGWPPNPGGVSPRGSFDAGTRDRIKIGDDRGSLNHDGKSASS
jgi:hypothetical protein